MRYEVVVVVTIVQTSERNMTSLVLPKKSPKIGRQERERREEKNSVSQTTEEYKERRNTHKTKCLR